MKNLYYLLVLLPMLLFTSCAEKNVMIGTWTIDGVYVNGLEMSEILSAVPEVDCILESTLTFAEDLSLDWAMCGDTESMTYTYVDGEACIQMPSLGGGEDGAIQLCGEVMNGSYSVTLSNDVIEMLNGLAGNMPGMPEIKSIVVMFAKQK